MRLLVLAIAGLFLPGCLGTSANNEPPPPCTPRCDGRVCGIDGCGGLCGSCPLGMSCTLAGQCTASCTPSCTGRECGDDGCGGSCGTCSPELTCGIDGRCFLCIPDCTARQCGDDGCGGSCGTCTSTAVCANGACCFPDCTGAQCGFDGCDGTCGGCPQGMVCNEMRQCEPCTPDCAGRQCGGDGCDGSCGDCADGQVCLFATGQCCTPSCDGRQCGDDGCGGLCGECGANMRCNAAGSCEPCNRDCTGLECSDDGCCGRCLDGLTCLPSGICFCQETCTPNCADRRCGPDDCGGSCGGCGAGTACRFDAGRTPGWQCDPFAATSPAMTFFVTSTGSMGSAGNLGGLAGADARCRQLAEAAGVTGRTWRAYLSDSANGIAARDRIGAGPWFNAYGMNVLTSTCSAGGNPTCIEALHRDQPPAWLIVTERGETLEWGVEHDIWTGSNPDGTPSGLDCRGWTSSSVDDGGIVGHVNGRLDLPEDSSWNAAHPTGCDFFSLTCTLGRGHIYCFAVD